MRLRAMSDNFATWVRPSNAIGAIVPSAICTTMCERYSLLCTMKSRLRKDSSAS